MQCETCGKDIELFLTEIEGTQLKLCKECGRYGKIIKRVKSEEEIKKDHKKELKREKLMFKPVEKEIVQEIVEDYALKVKNAREKLGLKQEEFSKQINERNSVIHNIETGKHKPSISLAGKLEKALKIQLIEEYKTVKEPLKAEKSETLTIGDMIKIKKR